MGRKLYVIESWSEHDRRWDTEYTLRNRRDATKELRYLRRNRANQNIGGRLRITTWVREENE